MSAVGMKCEVCGGSSYVVDTRESKFRNGIHRRRKCSLCNSIWATVELNADFIKYIIKTNQDGRGDK